MTLYIQLNEIVNEASVDSSVAGVHAESADKKSIDAKIAETDTQADCENIPDQAARSRSNDLSVSFNQLLNVFCIR